MSMQAERSDPQTAVAVFKPPRLPYHDAIEQRFKIDRAGWKALVEAIFPLAKTTDSIVMALSYCRARNLDPFKRPVHIVPMWSTAVGGMVETVWPGIAELRTTAFRTGNYAGMDEAEWGPAVEQTFKGKAGRGPSKGSERQIVVHYPSWCRITVYRELHGKICKFVGPKVVWLEAYATWVDTEVPNEMWASRPEGQLEKCAEAAALRRAFPEEIGNELTAEEMTGRKLDDVKDVAAATEPPAPPPPPPPPAAKPSEPPPPPPPPAPPEAAASSEPPPPDDETARDGEIVWDDGDPDPRQVNALTPEQAIETKNAMLAEIAQLGSRKEIADWLEKNRARKQQLTAAYQAEIDNLLDGRQEEVRR